MPDSLLVCAADQGGLNIFRRLHHASLSRYIPKKALFAAFDHNHVDVCRYILTQYPTYRPSDEQLVAACSRGRVALLQLLPPKLALPPECLMAAAKSKEPSSIDLISWLHARRGFRCRYDTAMLEAAVNSGLQRKVMQLIQFGRFNPPPPTLAPALVRNRMNDMLAKLHAKHVRVYTEDTLRTAVAVCNAEVIQRCVENHVRLQPEVAEALMRRIDVAPYPQAQRQQAKKYLQSLNKTV